VPSNVPSTRATLMPQRGRRRLCRPTTALASDDFTASMFSSLGNQAYLRGVANLFLTVNYTAADRRLVAHKKISYVVADRRITEQLPAAGYYFSPDPHQGLYKEPSRPQRLTSSTPSRVSRESSTTARS